jgi:succinyl-diaminopimelate desuccinylase
VNPCHDGAQDVLAEALESLGFCTKRYPFEGVDNLYARLGGAAPNFCFAGHTDVVPVGDAAGWTVDPFGAEIRDGVLYGRGTSDMKGAIAAFVSATARYVADHGRPSGSISLLITGDEEGPGLHGTRRLLPAVLADGETIDHCIVGEPTSEDRIADIVKNGRRGSLNCVLKAVGRQGHAAYPEKSANPMPVMLDALQKLRALKLDNGSPGFQPSNLEITTIDVGNTAHNVIPAQALAKFNIRFNPNHTGADLMARLEQLIGSGRDGVHLSLEMRVTGEAFYTEPGRLTELIVAAVEAETGRKPDLTTGGGTSDARYIKDVCPVAELGVRNEMAHKVDEHIPVDEIETLCRIYYRLLAGYFAAA